VNPSTFDLREPESRRIEEILSRVCRDVRAELALLTNRGGHLIATSGKAGDIDATALVSLAAANLASAESLAGTVGEGAFPATVHQGRRRSLLMSGLADGFSLVLVFDASVSAEAARLGCGQARPLLEDVLGNCRRTEAAPPDGLRFSDEDLESLLG